MQNRWLLFLVLTACNGEDKTADTGAADADSDTDSDSDSDTDTDTDADYTSLSGTVDLTTTVNGTTECTRNYTVVGTPYTEDCASDADCLFAFEMTSTEASSTGECAWVEASLTWTEEGTIVDPLLAFASAYTSETEIPLTNVVFWGYSLDLTAYGGTISGPDWYVFGATEDTTSTVTWDGSVLGIESVVTDTVPQQSDYLHLCDYNYVGDSANVLADGTAHTDTLPCDGQSFDVWEFDAIAGDVLQVVLDNSLATGDPDDTLLPFFQLTDATGCALVHSVPTFDCSAQVGGTGAPQCDSLEWTMLTTGTYRLTVETVDVFGLCTGGVGPYTLTTSLGGAPLSLALLAQEEPFFQDPLEVSNIAHFSATITAGR